MVCRVVTGWYPSKATADKILDRVKGNCPHARVVCVYGCFSVILESNLDYNTARKVRDGLIRRKVYCGIECVDELWE